MAKQVSMLHACLIPSVMGCMLLGEGVCLEVMRFCQVSSRERPFRAARAAEAFNSRIFTALCRPLLLLAHLHPPQLLPAASAALPLHHGRQAAARRSRPLPGCCCSRALHKCASCLM
jgi:hypothetical protein